MNEEALSPLSQADDTATIDLGRGGFPGTGAGSRGAGTKLARGSSQWRPLALAQSREKMCTKVTLPPLQRQRQLTPLTLGLPTREKKKQTET